MQLQYNNHEIIQYLSLTLPACYLSLIYSKLYDKCFIYDTMLHTHILGNNKIIEQVLNQTFSHQHVAICN